MLYDKFHIERMCRFSWERTDMHCADSNRMNAFKRFSSCQVEFIHIVDINRLLTAIFYCLYFMVAIYHEEKWWQSKSAPFNQKIIIFSDFVRLILNDLLRVTNASHDAYDFDELFG